MLIKNMCPNCGGIITEERLVKGLPCDLCVPETLLKKNDVDLPKVLNSLNKGFKLFELFLMEDELRRFEDFFTSITKGKKLWSIQRSWAKRMLSGESFALIAPTGVGKSTLLQTYAVYNALKGKAVLYIVPTRQLMAQVTQSIKLMSNNNILITTSDNFKEYLLLRNLGRIDVLTHAFIHKNLNSFNDLRYNVVIVDDFDALLKSSTIIDVLLNLLGISKTALDLAVKVLQMKQEAIMYKYLGNVEKMRELLMKVENLELNLAKNLDYVNVGQLLIASATGRGKGNRVRVLRELLGFELGSITDYMRNIVEVYQPLNYQEVVELLRKLAGGTLIFVSKDLGLNKAKELVSMLKAEGFKVSLGNSRKALDKMRNGEVDILVGVSTYYGILTRGIDEPLRIYNTVFIGIPKFEFSLDALLLNPIGLVKLMNELSKHGYKPSAEDISVVKAVKKLNSSSLKVLQKGLKGFIELNGYLKELSTLILLTVDRVRKFIVEKLNASEKLVLSYLLIKRKDKDYVCVIPDVMTYIQASGRSSRLLNGRMTLGLSVIFFDDEDLLKIFINKIRNYINNYSLKPLNQVDLTYVKEQQVLSRSLSNYSNSSMSVDKVKSALVIVESPTKAKTIAKMFGIPGKRVLGDYVTYETVVSLGDKVYVMTIAPTLGHLLDITIGEGLHGVLTNEGNVTPIYTTLKRCYSCGHQFTEDVSICPKCGSGRIRDSKKIIEALRKISKEVDEVFIATDPDDEGEKIAYDVYLSIKPFNKNIKRIEFHEVTRQAFIKALNNPREIDLHRVNAQIVRRVDDRLLGFELSNILQARFNKKWLGGGRVQTPVLKWVVDRYVEYVNSRGYKVVIYLPNELKVNFFFEDEEDMRKLISVLDKELILIEVLDEKEKEVSPLPPYTTDAILSEATKTLKLSPTTVMKGLQDLFELGYITYHRTDSTHVSNAGIEIAKEYFNSRPEIQEIFTPRSWGEEGTHECIRPTKPLEKIDEDLWNSNTLNLTWVHKSLYEMIFRRFMASQAGHARILYKKVRIRIGSYETIAEYPVKILKAGFTKLTPIRVYEELSDIKESIKIAPSKINYFKTSKITLLSASDIIKLMKENRIGRPSTYAKAIENNLRHGYIVLSKKKQFIIPTKIGLEINNFILKNYPYLTTPQFTRDLELLLDLVRSGRIDRDKALTFVLSDVIILRILNSLSITSSMKEVKIVIDSNELFTSNNSLLST